MQNLLVSKLVAFIFLINAVLVFYAAQGHADQSSLCVDIKDAKIIGAFYHSKNKSDIPDYCEYHFFKNKPLEKLVADNDSGGPELTADMGDEMKIGTNTTSDQETDRLIDYHVKYTNIKGEFFAQKELKFSSGLKTPSVNQLDLRSGERRYAAPKESNEFGLWEIRYRKNETKEEKSWDLNPVDMDVNDAGFVRKVRQSWDKLAAGESVKFNFLSIAHGKPIKMSAKKNPTADCNLPSGRDSKDFTCIKVSISNYLIRLIAPALWLSFDKESGNLLVFKGIVNLRDEDGENQTGTIYYRYL